MGQKVGVLSQTKVNYPIFQWTSGKLPFSIMLFLQLFKEIMMRLGAYVAAGFASILLAGCATGPSKPEVNWNDPQAVAFATSVTRDDFKKMTTYKSPDAAQLRSDSLFLRAWKTDSTGVVEYQIYVVDNYSDQWRFYHSAFDSDGNKLDFLSIDRKVGSCRGGCDYYEHVALNVSRGYLEKHQETGIRFKISGKAGEAVKFLPSSYIKGFLKKVSSS